MDDAGISAARQVIEIERSGLTIYDLLDERPELYVPTPLLGLILRSRLIGTDLDYPPRTRSKVLKAQVCQALGYPIPSRFRRTQPRFPGQNFDTYVQKADNLQIWNEPIAPSRRYVLVRVDAAQVVTGVRIVTGNVPAELDRTGRLTQKYQAKSRQPVGSSALVSDRDTPNVVRRILEAERAVELPDALDSSRFLPIARLHEILVSLRGTLIADPGIGQERKRGAALHRAVCERLGGPPFADRGQFPDIVEQLLELKLQLASTIDLGLVRPDDAQALADCPGFHQDDVRFAIVYATSEPPWVRLDHIVLTTGADFYKFFQGFEGKVRNTKLQIPLPRDFFDQSE